MPDTQTSVSNVSWHFAPLSSWYHDLTGCFYVYLFDIKLSDNEQITGDILIVRINSYYSCTYRSDGVTLMGFDDCFLCYSHTVANILANVKKLYSPDVICWSHTVTNIRRMGLRMQTPPIRNDRKVIARHL